MAILTNFLKSIADAIRNKKGTVLPINAQNFASEIESIEPIYDEIELNQNGEYDVSDYKKAVVNYTSDDSTKLKNLIERTVTTYELPYGTTKIGKYCFYWWTSLSSITIPESVTYIDEGAFNMCTSLNNVIIPNSVTFMSKKVFYACRGLINITLSNNLQLLNEELFSDCSNLHNLTIPNSVKSIGKKAFYMSSLKNLTTIPDSVTSIGEGAFYSSKLTSLKLSKNITSIPNDTFRSCSQLKNITLPDGITSIGEGAFRDCSLLTSITIPASVTNISGYALRIGSSSNKANIIMKSETPCTFSYSAVLTSNLNKIWVPKGTSASYKSATNWSSYADYIFEPNNIAFNVDSSLLNNSSVTYSIDNGEMQQFTNSSFTLENVSTLTITNSDASKVIKVGTTAGGSEVGTIANATTTYTFDGDTTIYISVQ